MRLILHRCCRILSLARLLQIVLTLTRACSKRMINVSRIEHIAMKNPWERRPDEVETVRKEIAKMEVFRKIDVSPAAERDICKFVRLRVYRPG